MSDEHFRDVRGDIKKAGHGVLEGDAIGRFDSAKTDMADDRSGIVITAVCGGCNRDNEITCNWQELIYIGHGVVPGGWQWDQSGHIRPYLGCPACGKVVDIGLTPDECKRHVHAAVQARILPPALVQQVTMQLQQQQGQQLARR